MRSAVRERGRLCFSSEAALVARCRASCADLYPRLEAVIILEKYEISEDCAGISVVLEARPRNSAWPETGKPCQHWAGTVTDQPINPSPGLTEAGVDA